MTATGTPPPPAIPIPTADHPSTLAGSLAAVQSQLPHVTKDRTAQVKSDKGSYSYSYADLSAVTKEILPLLGRNGLAWTTRPTFGTDGRFVLIYELIHVSGQKIAGEYPLPSSGTPQSMGSAITYARRYTLCSVTGVAPDTDDDDAAAAQEQARPQRTVQRAPRREQAQEPEPAPARPTRQVRPAPRGDAPPLPGENPAGVTEPQLRAINAILGKRGIADRGERLRVVGAIVRRAVDSTKDLTRAEAHTLIERLQEADADDVRDILADTDVPDVDEDEPDLSHPADPVDPARPDPWGINRGAGS